MSTEREETLIAGTIVFMAGEPWELRGEVKARHIPPFKCPHCGSGKGTWFDRSTAIDNDGNEIPEETFPDRCSDCGKNVAAPASYYNR
jgi:predicted RNA-binding Zn-ribbon protein involved in translation (DUF1610 family)